MNELIFSFFLTLFLTLLGFIGVGFIVWLTITHPEVIGFVLGIFIFIAMWGLVHSFLT